MKSTCRQGPVSCSMSDSPVVHIWGMGKTFESFTRTFTVRQALCAILFRIRWFPSVTRSTFICRRVAPISVSSANLPAALQFELFRLAYTSRLGAYRTALCQRDEGHYQLSHWEDSHYAIPQNLWCLQSGSSVCVDSALLPCAPCAGDDTWPARSTVPVCPGDFDQLWGCALSISRQLHCPCRDSTHVTSSLQSLTNLNCADMKAALHQKIAQLWDYTRKLNTIKW